MFILILFRMAKKTRKGIKAKIIKVSGMLRMHISTKDPARVTIEMNTSSGPWWASSLISIRSLTIRDMMAPVLFLSK